MSDHANKAEYQTAVIRISGMSCEHCVRRIENSLNTMAGIAEASIDLATEKATVKYRPAEVNPEKLKDAIRKAGYEVADN